MGHRWWTVETGLAGLIGLPRSERVLESRCFMIFQVGMRRSNKKHLTSKIVGEMNWLVSRLSPRRAPHLEEYRTPWTCAVLGCSTDTEDCRSTECCVDEQKTCYEKDSSWAGCRSSCTPGADIRCLFLFAANNPFCGCKMSWM